MSAADLTAGTVMDGAAALLNDTAKSVYTYAAQIPYLKIALQELREHYELNDIPVTEDVSAVIQVDAGATRIIYNGVADPSLPNDFVEPKQLWERARDENPFIPMIRRDFLPHSLEGIETSNFMFYVWQSQEIRFLPANRNNDIKIDYTKELFQNIVDENSAINVVNGISFLEYRTAALCAEFIGHNKAQADSLNLYASLASDRTTGIGVKSKQTIFTRRRPFRQAYKTRRGF